MRNKKILTFIMLTGLAVSLTSCKKDTKEISKEVEQKLDDKKDTSSQSTADFLKTFIKSDYTVEINGQKLNDVKGHGKLTQENDKYEFFGSAANEKSGKNTAIMYELEKDSLTYLQISQVDTKNSKATVAVFNPAEYEVSTSSKSYGKVKYSQKDLPKIIKDILTDKKGNILDIEK